MEINEVTVNKLVNNLKNIQYKINRISDKLLNELIVEEFCINWYFPTNIVY